MLLLIVEVGCCTDRTPAVGGEDKKLESNRVGVAKELKIIGTWTWDVYIMTLCTFMNNINKIIDCVNYFAIYLFEILHIFHTATYLL